MSTDTPLCTFVDPDTAEVCAQEAEDFHHVKVDPEWANDLYDHPFVPPIERTMSDAVKDMHARWARQYDEYIAKGPQPVTVDKGETFVPIPDSDVPEPDVCHHRMPDGMSCGRSASSAEHSWLSHVAGRPVHGFLSAAEYARTQADKPSREYLVPTDEEVKALADMERWPEIPSTQILCTFRLAGGPCGKDSFDTVHRAHTDHPGFCGVYTCHAFRPEAGAKVDIVTMLEELDAALSVVLKAYKDQQDDGR